MLPSAIQDLDQGCVKTVGGSHHHPLSLALRLLALCCGDRLYGVLGTRGATHARLGLRMALGRRGSCAAS